MTWGNWQSWGWDIPTAGWALWILYFVVWETWTGLSHEGEMLTNHLRPVFLTFPVLWWTSLGLAIWAIVHLWFPAWEQGFLDVVRTKP